MLITLNTLSDLTSLGFDEIIDVRSPSEFAEDHLPGAINLPVLDDDERARIGTIYKQVSPFEARRLGAATVARNAAHHIETALADRTGGWRPLVHCWRGGQRSRSFALILEQIGWRVSILDGGYKAWRRLVVEALYDRPVPAPVVLIDGNTGSAKTAILNLLPAHGIQTIDLEGLANHRGSLFGATGTQPGQRAFEGRLAQHLAGLDPARPVVIEAENSAIGRVKLPPGLWKAMCHAPRITIEADRAERARYLTHAYADMTADPERLLATIGKLRPYQPATRIADWEALVLAGEFETLAAELMEWHYDPRYARHRARIGASSTAVTAPSLAPDGLERLAADIASMAGPLAAAQEPHR
ncbi:tRNA 2-selenouridine(34) synthase MnmH [Paracoccus marinaquae]|uniref:tRNA 2-selenouridine(34) synthase MnmH n=1 Tax=Paracoccus marinaquae TaxID=2841926 RepID=A0ABS6AG05_9RHOB|nr:tRNA 2-selenouridine(34) synthase MnmH [Paracoccus marinaquae]MBU3029448.1 tRNA 2-selenouridine(34) synthase MnmH [Paracoccus marinaquae]